MAVQIGMTRGLFVVDDVDVRSGLLTPVSGCSRLHSLARAWRSRGRSFWMCLLIRGGGGWLMRNGDEVVKSKCLKRDLDLIVQSANKGEGNFVFTKEACFCIQGSGVEEYRPSNVIPRASAKLAGSLRRLQLASCSCGSRTPKRVCLCYREHAGK